MVTYVFGSIVCLFLLVAGICLIRFARGLSEWAYSIWVDIDEGISSLIGIKKQKIINGKPGYRLWQSFFLWSYRIFGRNRVGPGTQERCRQKGVFRDKGECFEGEISVECDCLCATDKDSNATQTGGSPNAF